MTPASVLHWSMLSTFGVLMVSMLLLVFGLLPKRRMRYVSGVLSFLLTALFVADALWCVKDGGMLLPAFFTALWGVRFFSLARRPDNEGASQATSGC